MTHGQGRARGGAGFYGRGDEMKLLEHAAREGRDYVTPEDVQAAVNTGADRLETYIELLWQLAAKNVEDVDGACFVAHRWQREEER